MREHKSPDPESYEPVLTAGTITTLATAALALAVAFGLPVSDTVQAELLGLIAVLAPLVLALVARGRVYSPATVATLLRAQAMRAPRRSGYSPPSPAYGAFNPGPEE